MFQDAFGREVVAGGKKAVESEGGGEVGVDLCHIDVGVFLFESAIVAFYIIEFCFIEALLFLPVLFKGLVVEVLESAQHQSFQKQALTDHPAHCPVADASTPA